MNEPTEHSTRGGRRGETEQPAPTAPAQETLRLTRLREEMVTPWQLPPIGARSDASGAPSPLGHPEAVDSDYVVAWQLTDARS